MSNLKISGIPEEFSAAQAEIEEGISSLVREMGGKVASGNFKVEAEHVKIEGRLILSGKTTIFTVTGVKWLSDKRPSGKQTIHAVPPEGGGEKKIQRSPQLYAALVAAGVIRKGPMWFSYQGKNYRLDELLVFAELAAIVDRLG